MTIVASLGINMLQDFIEKVDEHGLNYGTNDDCVVPEHTQTAVIKIVEQYIDEFLEEEGIRSLRNE